MPDWLIIDASSPSILNCDFWSTFSKYRKIPFPTLDGYLFKFNKWDSSFCNCCPIICHIANESFDSLSHFLEVCESWFVSSERTTVRFPSTSPRLVRFFSMIYHFNILIIKLRVLSLMKLSCITSFQYLLFVKNIILFFLTL